MDQLNNKVILIVDDEEIIREIMVEALSCIEKLSILQACNGSEAITELNKHDIDILITDLKMPVKDGFGLLQYLNEEYEKNLITIVCSGYVDQDKGRLQEFNIFKVIGKPFNIDLFINEIENLM